MVKGHSSEGNGMVGEFTVNSRAFRLARESIMSSRTLTRHGCILKTLLGGVREDHKSTYYLPRRAHSTEYDLYLSTMIELVDKHMLTVC